MDAKKQLAIKALEYLRSDDLPRVKRAFAGLSRVEMAEQYGDSGMSRAELLASYETIDAAITETIEWVRQL